jgi:hypothetical protein
VFARPWILTSVGVLALVVSVSSFAAGRARTARSVNLIESGHLHLTSRHGLHLNEQGSATGTIHGAVYIHLTLTSKHSFSVEVNVYPRAGSLTGYGSAGYHVVGGYGDFSGTLSIRRGTGTYAHARANNLRFTGSIQLSNDAVSVRLAGTLHY